MKKIKKKIILAITVLFLLLVFIPDPIDILTGGLPIIEGFFTLMGGILYYLEE